VTDLTLHDPAYSLDCHRTIAAPPNHLKAGSYRRERVSQFVRQHRQEFVFPSIGCSQLLLGAGTLDDLPGPLRGFLDQFDFVWRPDTR